MEGDAFINLYESFNNAIPPQYKLWVTLLFFAIAIAIYAIFIYYFYKFLAKKNIINLNLKQYNTQAHSGIYKFLAAVFYVIEYIVLLPVLTFLWFSFLAIFLLILSKIGDITTILTIAAALVAAVRLTSYVSENLSRDLAKLLPFTLLGLSLVDPSFFSIPLIFERISEVPSLISQIPYYLVFIFAIELIARLLDLFAGLFNSDDK